jgi:tripartite-type tricarboxylate transporter receptor subunit TctC
MTGAAVAPFALNGLPAFGQDAWPAKEIHVICGYAPGTGADILVRYFSEKLLKYTKQPMVVENNPGAGTSIASEYTVRS